MAEADHTNTQAGDVHSRSQVNDVLVHVGSWSESPAYDSIVNSPWALLDESVFQEPYQFVEELPIEQGSSVAENISTDDKKRKKKARKSAAARS